MKQRLTLLITSMIFVFACASFAADKNYTNSIGMEFVLIPSGSFKMGTPARSVTISQPFYLGKYEVTQEEWYKVMGNNPARFTSEKIGKNSRRFPVELVSWNDVQMFVKRLNAMEGGNHYSLPTEAEWEYAAMGGQNYTYSGSNNSDEVGWYIDNSFITTHEVGTKKPNGYGLYDMSGNVWEWVKDLYDEKAYSWLSSTDPVNNNNGSRRVYRGGSFGCGSDSLRSAARGSDSPISRHCDLGFRLLRTAN